MPQGSVLGPLLFLVFINYITNAVKHCKIRLFADDTCLYIDVDNRVHCADLINTDLRAIEIWSKKWLVEFSAPKTESMVIGYKPNPQEHPTLLFCDIPISVVSKHKHIGLWLESNLWWHYHIQEVAFKAQKRLNVLSYLKHRINGRQLEILYFAFIRPIMEYGSVVWAGAHQADLEILNRIQIKAMHIVTGCTKGTSPEILYDETGWLSLESRRNLATLNLFYRCVNKDVPQYLSELLPTQNRNIIAYTLRNPTNFVFPKCRLLCHSQSFIPRAIKLWNNLSIETHQKPTLRTFKMAIDPKCNNDKAIYKWKKFWSDLGSRSTAIILAN